MSAAFFGIFIALYLFALLVLRGVSGFVAVLSLVLVGGQIAFGASVWRHSSSRPKATTELVGVGLGIGSLVAAISDSLLVGVGLPGIGAWVVAGVGITSLCVWGWRERGLGRMDLNPSTSLCSLIAIAASLAVVGREERSALFGSACLFATVLVSRIHSSAHARNLYLGLCCAASLLVMKFVVDVDGATLPRKLVPLLAGSDDQIKSEQLAFSISNWGLSTNSAAIGLPIRFHWLALAWSGSLTTAAQAEPFDVTLHVVPVFVVIGIFFSAFGLARRLHLSTWLSYLYALLVLLGSTGDGEMRFIFALTTTNLVPHLWILLLLHVLLSIFQDRSPVVSRLLLLFLPAAVILGKGPYGLVVVAGLLWLMVARIRSHRSMAYSSWLMVSLAVLFAFIGYLAFLRSPLTDSYVVDLERVWTSLPFPLPVIGSGALMTNAIALLSVGLFVVIRMPWLLRRHRQTGNSSFSVFLVGMSIAGLISFLVRQPGSETYFFNGAVVASSLLSCLAVADVSTATFSRQSIRWAAVALIPAVLGVLLLLAWISDQRIRYYLAAPLVVLLAVAIRNQTRCSMRSIFVLAACVTSISAGLATSRFTSVGVESFISKNELDVFEWIRNNTPENAIFTTDREFCRASVTCEGYTRGMPTAAAFTQRRFLIEGSRALTPTRMWAGPYPDELKGAAEATLQLIESRGADRARTYGADWHLGYHGDKTSNFELRGMTIVFARGDVRVYRSSD